MKLLEVVDMYLEIKKVRRINRLAALIINYHLYFAIMNINLKLNIAKILAFTKASCLHS